MWVRVAKGRSFAVLRRCDVVQPARGVGSSAGRDQPGCVDVAVHSVPAALVACPVRCVGVSVGAYGRQ
jgi:hypothetical protein